MEGYYENLKTQSRSITFPKTPDPNKTVTSDDFTLIKNYEFFKNLSNFPDNTQGTCAIVALCIELAYLGKYDNYLFIGSKDFISNGAPTPYLHDYLFHNCLHTIMGIGSGGRYPVASTEIKTMMSDYIYNRCDPEFRKHERILTVLGFIHMKHLEILTEEIPY